MGRLSDNSIGRRAIETLSSLRRDSERRTADDRRPEDLVDAYFDGELAPDESRAFFEAIRSDDSARRDYEATQEALDALRAPVDAPDLSASILAEVGRRRGWLPTRLRQYVTFGRVSIAACLLLLLTGAFLVERESPGALTLSEPDAPLANLVETGRSEASVGFRQVSSAIESLRSGQAARPADRDTAEFTFSANASERRRSSIAGLDRAASYPPLVDHRNDDASKRCDFRGSIRGALRGGDAMVTIRVMMPAPAGDRSAREAEAPAALRCIDD